MTQSVLVQFNTAHKIHSDIVRTRSEMSALPARLGLID